MKKFAIVGNGGFVAPRHLKAIKETDNELIAALDPSDSVGILDNFFPDAAFFTEHELFDRHLSKLKRAGKGIDYFTVCTPNYLHDAHIRYGLRLGAHVIAEKPLVLNPWNVDALKVAETESGFRIFNILQLRLHDVIKKLKSKIDSSPDRIYDVNLTYITSRGLWYYASWKGNVNKSGGIATNIGVHFYDMLQWIFGPVQSNTVHVHSHDRVAGYLELQKARVRYFLSIDYDTLPKEVKDRGERTFRSLSISGEQVEFSNGFTELHTRSYRQILSGEGYGLDDVKPSIQIVHDIRHATPVGLKGDYHPMAGLDIKSHPFGWK